MWSSQPLFHGAPPPPTTPEWCTRGSGAGLGLLGYFVSWTWCQNGCSRRHSECRRPGPNSLHTPHGAGIKVLLNRWFETSRSLRATRRHNKASFLQRSSHPEVCGRSMWAPFSTAEIIYLAVRCKHELQHQMTLKNSRGTAGTAFHWGTPMVCMANHHLLILLNIFPMFAYGFKDSTLDGHWSKPPYKHPEILSKRLT